MFNNAIMRKAAIGYLNAMIQYGNLLGQKGIEQGILKSTNDLIDVENALRPKDNQLRHVNRLGPAQIADTMAVLYPICIVQSGIGGTDRSHDLLVILQ